MARLAHPTGQLRTWLDLIAKSAGFDELRVTAPDAALQSGDRLAEFVALGRHGEMDWMAETLARRKSPRALWPDVRSVIMLAKNYGPARDPLAATSNKKNGAIACYAQGSDYHEIVKSGLKQVARALAERTKADVKVFVDTAPVLEKPLAAAAGLGWQGKHTNLVSRRFGSWLFLGAIFTTAEIPADEPETDHCGTCRACLDICPTNAFPAPYQLDARRCISYLTIEHQGPVPHDLRAGIGNRIFGCDDCLAVCPWNKFAELGRDQRLAARDELANPPLAEILALDDAQFRQRFRGTPVKRTGRNRLLRNALIAAGNSRDTALLEPVTRLLGDPAPIVRGAAVWALGELSEDEDILALAKSNRGREDDDTVNAEWQRIAPL